MRYARFILIVVAGSACDWGAARMNDQARCEPGDTNRWLPDQRCDHRAPEGTVAWRTAAAPPMPAATQDVILRGADRYARMCAACHGMLGDARTPVARDMTLRPPPSLHMPVIVAYPDQRLYEVISSGYGMMPAYDYQLVPEDRWAVVHYVRVLQRSQAVALESLSPDRRAEAQRWLR